MALTELNVNATKPKSISKTEDEDELEVELLEEENELDQDEDDADLFLEDLEEEQEEQEEDDELETEEVDEEDEIESEEEEDFDDDEDDEDEEVSTRENDRIRSLIEAQKVKDLQLKKEKAERKKLQEQMISLQKTTKESTTNVLKNHIQALKSQMVQAQQNDDSETYIDLQEQLNKTQMDLVALESWEPPEIEEEVEEEETVQQNQAADMDISKAPASVQNWVSKNPWFRTPKSPKDVKRQKEAIAYSQILASEGYSMESEEFFTLVDGRLEQLGLAKSKKNKVKSKNNKTSSKRRKNKKKISQTVQGASRNSRSKTQSKKNKVTLTPEQQNIASLYGMSNEEYALELLKIEKSENEGKRMTTLSLDSA